MWHSCFRVVEKMKTELQERLFNLQDTEYKAFHSKLMPTVNPDTVIGIRTPLLRKFANEFSKTDEAKAFLKELPHQYYEENNLHAFLLEKTTDYPALIEELNIFLPFVDNWATCDMMKPKIFRQNKDHLISFVSVQGQSSIQSDANAGADF